MMAFLRQPLSKRVVFTCAAEIVAFNAIFFTCHRLLLSATAGDSTSPLAATFITFFLLFNNAVIQFALWSFGVYTRDALHSLQRAFLPIIGAIMFGMINALPVYWLFAFVEELPLRIPFYQALLVFPSFALFLVVERYVLARLLEDVSRLGNVLVLGTGPDTERVVEEIRRRSAGNLRLAGVLSARREEVGQEVAGCEILGHVSELRGPVADLKVDSIVIALDEKDRALLSAEVLFRCKDAGIAVLDTRDFHQIAARTARPAKAMEPA